MRFLLLFSALSIIAAPATAERPPLTAKQHRDVMQTVACGDLGERYVSISKELAMIDVEARSQTSQNDTAREIRVNTAWQKASLIVNLMESANCSLPKDTPNSAVYEKAAINCEKAMMRLSGANHTVSVIPKECLYENWKPDQSHPMVLN